MKRAPKHVLRLPLEKRAEMAFKEAVEEDDGDYWIRDLLIEPVLEEFPFYGHRKVTKELRRRRWRYARAGRPTREPRRRGRTARG